MLLTQQAPRLNLMEILLHHIPTQTAATAPDQTPSQSLPIYFFLGWVCFSFWMTMLNVPVTSGCCVDGINKQQSQQPAQANVLPNWLLVRCC